MSKTTVSRRLKIVKILDEETAQKYIPQNEDRIIPKVWELPNRKSFFNWVLKTYAGFDKSKVDTKDKKKGKDEKETPLRMELFSQQKLVRDFISDESPYRGLLLYHGLGVGKTCASIAISKTITDPEREVWVFSKASLEGNYIKGIKDCGMDTVRNQNNWVFIECENKVEKNLALNVYGIPEEVIKHNYGAFIINYSDNTPNYNKL